MNLEKTSKPEYISTKYSSPRDEVLHHLSLEGWANQSSGDTASTTGYFARISNSEAELQELTTNFEEAMQSAGLVDPSALIGHYLLVETDDGFVHVGEYKSEEEVIADYLKLEAAYEDWAGELA